MHRSGATAPVDPIIRELSSPRCVKLQVMRPLLGCQDSPAVRYPDDPALLAHKGSGWASDPDNRWCLLAGRKPYGLDYSMTGDYRMAVWRRPGVK